MCWCPAFGRIKHFLRVKMFTVELCYKQLSLAGTTYATYCIIIIIIAKYVTFYHPRFWFNLDEFTLWRGEPIYDSSGAVRKSRWTSWAPVPNKPMVSVDVKQHFILCVQHFMPDMWGHWVPHHQTVYTRNSFQWRVSRLHVSSFFSRKHLTLLDNASEMSRIWWRNHSDATEEKGGDTGNTFIWSWRKC